MISPDNSRFIYDLLRAPREVKDGAGVSVAKVIKRVEVTGRSLAPVDEGEGRDSITSDVRIEDGAVIGEAGPEAYWMRFQEFGTATMAPQAHMGPALDRHSHELDELLGQVGEHAIERGFLGNLLGIDISV